MTATEQTRDILTTAQACEYLGVSRATFDRLRKKHHVKRIKSGLASGSGLVRYTRGELERLTEKMSRVSR